MTPGMRTDLYVQPGEKLSASKENAKVDLMVQQRPRAGHGLRERKTPDGIWLSTEGRLMPSTPWRVWLLEDAVMVRPGLCKGVEATIGGVLLTLDGGPRRLRRSPSARLVGLLVRFRGRQITSVEVALIASLADVPQRAAWRTIALLKGPPANPKGAPVRVIQVVSHHQDFEISGDLENWKDIHIGWHMAE